ncbi:LacI family DNA-binding transcriptional regulator [Cellulomonas sp. WB94]|uniref:LacI family DNA-binding transcriptional regulator n=1 Tax=Cellulomonas sp. WB94 TaxID=2173174 RepID=UPI001304F383|nr:LacI family DNA-binding transcriptional regulator [Cellulomonas sp. WB94]
MTAVPARRRQPTITDVAARAGVSTATVSKVMNARHGVSGLTAHRVLAAVEAMGYEPSLAATRLRGGAARVVGVLLSDLGHWAGEVLKGVSAAAAGSGYGVLVFSAAGTTSVGGWERPALIRLGGTLIDGAILLAPSHDVTCVNVPVVEVAAQGTLRRHLVGGRDGAPEGAVRAAAPDRPHELGGAAFTMLLALIGSGTDGPRARLAPPLQWRSHSGPVCQTGVCVRLSSSASSGSPGPRGLAVAGVCGNRPRCCSVPG